MTPEQLFSRVQCSRLASTYRRIRRRVRAWIFGAPTVAIEILNGLLLTAWGLTLLQDGLAGQPTYPLVTRVAALTWASEVAAGMFVLAAVFAFVGVLRRDPRGERLSSFSLQLGGTLWAVVAVNFWAAYPPLHPSALAYTCIAAVTWLSGCVLWSEDDL